MVNLGIKPYTGWMKSHRGKKLAAQFPQYDSKILSAFSETANLVDYKKERTVEASTNVAKSKLAAKTKI